MLRRWLWQTILALVVLWTLGCVTCDREKDLATCSFYYWRVNWATAVRTCLHEEKELLCYKSKKDIDDITEAFRLATFGSARLELWLSRRNCSPGPPEKCLSLHIQKTGTHVWHFFQSECMENFPFVCCVNGSGGISTDNDYSSQEPLTSDHFELTDVSSWSTSPGHPTPDGHDHFCPGVTKRGIDWPETGPGEVAVRPCPEDFTGEARWICENSTRARWKDEPDLSKCRSLLVQDLKERFNRSSATDVISELESIFTPDTNMFGDDLADVMSLMSFLPSKLFEQMQPLSPEDKWPSTSSNVDKVVSIVNRMVAMNSTWEDIDLKERTQVGTNLLSTVDGMAGLLADCMPEDETEKHYIHSNMALQVLRTSSGQSVTLPRDLSVPEGQITLSRGYDRDLEKDGNLSLVFALYRDMSRVLPPTRSKKHEPVLNSAVLSATVMHGRRAQAVRGEVRIRVRLLTASPNHSACAFWNMDSQAWDTAGCRLASTDEDHGECVCDHLTNFALLMDYRGLVGELDQRPFHYITLVGCYLSIVSLAICVFIFSCYSYHSRHSWGLRYVIHRNLCICLLIANIVLVAGLDSTRNQKICAVVAGLLHYFFLAAFSWMLLEAVHIYLLLVVVFASRRSHSEAFYGFGYGFPLVIVVITAFSRPKYYGTDQICWLSPEKGTIWAFMGPVACILILNIAALVLAQYKASKVSAKDDKVALAKRWLRVTIILFPILGITWIFGFLYMGEYSEIAAYLFAFFNSFQGVCIFIFHCIFDKKARNMVVDSFKKRNVTILTGTSSTQKKSKDNAQNGANSIPPIEFDDSSCKDSGTEREVRIAGGHKRDWSKWRKPWSFCFELTVSEKSAEKKAKREKKKKTEAAAVITNWNSLKDRNCS